MTKFLNFEIWSVSDMKNTLPFPHFSPLSLHFCMQLQQQEHAAGKRCPSARPSVRPSAPDSLRKNSFFSYSIDRARRQRRRHLSKAPGIGVVRINQERLQQGPHPALPNQSRLKQRRTELQAATAAAAEMRRSKWTERGERGGGGRDMNHIEDGQGGFRLKGILLESQVNY
jgi:hypothetical protein